MTDKSIKSHESRGKIAKSAIAAGLVFGLVASGAAAAHAGAGGGGVGGGGGGTEGNFSTHYMMSDGYNPATNTPWQGYMQNSVQWFFDNSGATVPYTTPTNAQILMRQACDDALTKAEGRRPAGLPAGQSRVVGMYWASDASSVWGFGSVNRDALLKLYNEWVSKGRPYVMNDLGANQALYYTMLENAFMEGYNATPPNDASAICLALNSAEPPMNYDLTLTTDKASTFELAGTSTAVTDNINASNGGSSIVENVNANVTLHWGGVEGNPAQVTKTVAVANNGTTASPNFVPADFGWASWPSGKFWFDVDVAKQGSMANPSSHAGENDGRENWTAAPTPPTKVLTSGNPADALRDDEVLASGMFYNAEVSARTNGYASSMTITDTIATDKVFIGSRTADVASAAYILDPAGNRVDGATINIDRSTAGSVKVSGTVTSIPGAFQAREYKLVVPTYVLPTTSDYTIADDSDVCYTASMIECIDGNNEQTRKVTPAPDKVWVLDENGALTEADPEHTNQEGADEKVFLMNDEVSAVVNGRVPGKLAEAMTNYQIIDDWTKAADYVDFSDPSKVKVFIETAPGSNSYQSVTSQFDITIDGTVTTATAKAGSDFLAQTKGQTADRKVKLVISGQFRDDYDTNGETVVLYNDGAEVWNNETIPTNEPPVYTWTPDPNKQVLGSADESGNNAHSDIDGLSVFPGQKLEYSVGVDLRIPAGTARGVKSLAVEDVYDPNFIPDKSSIEFWDSRDPRNPKPVPRSAYKIAFDEAAHKFTATFTDEWIAANVGADGANSEWLTQGWLTMRFTGTVSPDIAGGSTVKNQAFQIINDARTATEIPTVKVPEVKPEKEDLNTYLDNIDGKTVVQGDIILYRLTLDASVKQDELAYNVAKLGMVDDYDEEYLDLVADGIKVTDQATGEDVTAKFNVQVKDGVAYVFAKTVDTENVYGGTIPGDPQPADLKEYDERVIKPLEDANIDQALLGKKYWITLQTTVKKETDGYVIKNQAIQNIQNMKLVTNIVSNPLKDIDPDKDVVVSEETKDDSINEAEVKLYSTFNYRLNSSEIPANRAYAAAQWSMSDTFDRVHDSYTGIWAVYANYDIYNGDELVFKKGDLLADSAGHQSEPWNDLFAVTFDEETYTFKIEATQKYLDLVNTRMDLANSFSVYTKMERIAPSEKVENQVKETYNNVDRESNIVWTSTPENPAIDVEKFTLSEGFPDGDRDDAKLAYEMTPEELALAPLPEDAPEGAEATQVGTEVGIRVTNTGDVPLVNVSLVDATHAGLYGSVDNIVCLLPEAESLLAKTEAAAAGEENWLPADLLTELAVGEVVDCKGTLTGMEPGMLHGDTVIATGESVFTGKQVKDEDPWFAKAPSTPGVDLIKYTLEEGVEKGDRNEFKDALVLTPEQAKNGVQVGFDITNNGDEPLKDLDFSDLTHDATTGTVEDIKWAVALKDGETAGDGVPTIKLGTGEDEKTYKLVSLDELKGYTLAVDETITFVGTLKGVEAGTGHSDNATVNGTAVYSGTKVTDEDPWNAKFPTSEKPVNPGDPGTPPKGAVAGDPLAQTGASDWLLGGAAALLLLVAGGTTLLIRRRGAVATEGAGFGSEPEWTDRGE